MKILDVCCRWPGSAHDATVFQNSTLFERLENGEFGQDTIILGDSVYGPQRYVCKPLRNPLTPNEKKYQKAQIKTRNVGERTNGLLKKRFACMAVGMHYRLEKTQDVIVACCVLHNFIILENNVRATINQPEIDFQENMSDRLIATQNAQQRELHMQQFLIDSFFND